MGHHSIHIFMEKDHVNLIFQISPSDYAYETVKNWLKIDEME